LELSSLVVLNLAPSAARKRGAKDGSLSCWILPRFIHILIPLDTIPSAACKSPKLDNLFEKLAIKPKNKQLRNYNEKANNYQISLHSYIINPVFSVVIQTNKLLELAS